MQQLSLAVKGIIMRFVLEAFLEVTNHPCMAVAAVMAGICCDCRVCIGYVPLP